VLVVGISSRPETEFYDVLDACEKTTMNKWQLAIDDSIVEEFKWDTQSELEELNSRVQEAERKLRNDKLEQLSGSRLDHLLKNMSRHINTIIKNADTSDAKNNMWTQLSRTQDHHLGQFFNEIGELMTTCLLHILTSIFISHHIYDDA
jgi:predicted PurR-regulated permease PerM